MVMSIVERSMKPEDVRDRRICADSPSQSFISREVYTRAEARAEIRRMRAAGGWAECKFKIVPWNKYEPPGGWSEEMRRFNEGHGRVVREQRRNCAR